MTKPKSPSSPKLVMSVADALRIIADRLDDGTYTPVQYIQSRDTVRNSAGTFNFTGARSYSLEVLESSKRPLSGKRKR